MKKSRLLGALCVCLSAMFSNVNAAVLSYGGYTHDTSTNIVTGNGLEWLQWDVTVNYSISSIQSQVDTLEGGGWSVASNAQMAVLFNAFSFGRMFDVDENTYQAVNTGADSPDTSLESDRIFIQMFGDTYAASGSTYCYVSGCIEDSGAFFGLDIDGDARYNYAVVRDDFYYASGDFSLGSASIRNDTYTSTNSSAGIGVALVRTAVVPVPAAVWLFGSGLLGLIGIARRKKT